MRPRSAPGAVHNAHSPRPFEVTAPSRMEVRDIACRKFPPRAVPRQGREIRAQKYHDLCTPGGQQHTGWERSLKSL